MKEMFSGEPPAFDNMLALLKQRETGFHHL